MWVRLSPRIFIVLFWSACWLYFSRLTKLMNSAYVKRQPEHSLNFRSLQSKNNPEAKFAAIPERTLLATYISLHEPGSSNLTGNLHPTKFLGQWSIYSEGAFNTIHCPQYSIIHRTISIISAHNIQYYQSVFSKQQHLKLSHAIPQKVRTSQSNLA